MITWPYQLLQPISDILLVCSATVVKCIKLTKVAAYCGEFSWYLNNSRNPSLKMNNSGFLLWLNHVTVNVLKIRTLVACHKRIDKQGRPRSDCFWRSSLIWVFLIAFLKSSLGVPALITYIFLRTEIKVFDILEILRKENKFKVPYFIS